MNGFNTSNKLLANSVVRSQRGIIAMIFLMWWLLFDKKYIYGAGIDESICGRNKRSDMLCRKVEVLYRPAGAWRVWGLCSGGFHRRLLYVVPLGLKKGSFLLGRSDTLFGESKDWWRWRSGFKPVGAGGIWSGPGTVGRRLRLFGFNPAGWKWIDSCRS